MTVDRKHGPDPFALSILSSLGRGAVLATHTNIPMMAIIAAKTAKTADKPRAEN
jgi:hypothetical protein